MVYRRKVVMPNEWRKLLYFSLLERPRSEEDVSAIDLSPVLLEKLRYLLVSVIMFVCRYPVDWHIDSGDRGVAVV